MIGPDVGEQFQSALVEGGSFDKGIELLCRFGSALIGADGTLGTAGLRIVGRHLCVERILLIADQTLKRLGDPRVPPLSPRLAQPAVGVKGQGVRLEVDWREKCTLLGTR